MIALYGLPGSRMFAFRFVSTRVEGETWIAERSRPETKASLEAKRDSRVITNREAAKLRWDSGVRIVNPASLRDQVEKRASEARALAISIPYANCLDEPRADGALGVECPICKLACYGVTNGDEDEMTKSPARAYAKHYAEKHGEVQS